MNLNRLAILTLNISIIRGVVVVSVLLLNMRVFFFGFGMLLIGINLFIVF